MSSTLTEQPIGIAGSTKKTGLSRWTGGLGRLCAGMIALGCLMASTHASDASFSVVNSTLILTLTTNGMTTTIASQGTSYTFVLPPGKFWGGTNSAAVIGNFTGILTVTSSGISTLTNGIVVNDTGNNQALVFADSASSTYSNSFNVVLGNPGGTIAFNGKSTFVGAASLNASASNILTLNPSAIVSVGVIGNIKFQATNALLIDSGATLLGGASVSLEADTKANGTGDDGVGTLTINGAATVLGNAIALRGADIDIANTAHIGDTNTSAVFIHPSLPTLSMSLGGSNTAVTGVNLTDVELGQIVTAANGSITFGDPNLNGSIICTTATPATTAGAMVTLLQSGTGPGAIVLDTGGNALFGNGGQVNLQPGSGGVQVGQVPGDVSITTNGFTPPSASLVLTLNAPPALGEQITVVNNTGAPISGFFSNLANHGVITAMFGGAAYPFQGDYNSGSNGNSLVLASIAILPDASADPINAVTSATADVSGAVNPNGSSTNVSFDYGTTLTYGSSTVASPAIITGTNQMPVTAHITGLTPNTLYHFRVRATSSVGTTLSADKTFTTATVTDADATNISFVGGAVLNPVFNRNQLTYTATVPPSMTGIQTIVILDDVADVLMINGASYPSGATSSPFPLSTGPNPINVVVTAENGTTKKTYTVTVTRSATPVATSLWINPSSTSFTAGAQIVPLPATVLSDSGDIQEGTITFQLKNGAALVGAAVTSTAVVANSAAVNYSIPAGTPGGMYTIAVTYNGTVNFASSTDSTQIFTILPVASTVATSSVNVAYGSASQNIPTTVNLTSPQGPVNGGTVTVSLTDALSRTVGAPAISGTVANGSAQATLVLPGGTALGAYTINAVYSGSINFVPTSDNAKTLTVGIAPTQTTFGPAMTTFNPNIHNTPLTAVVTSPGGPVNEGMVTFQVFDGGVQVGPNVLSPAVSNGAVTAQFPVPANLAAKSYHVTAQYSGSTNYVSSSDGVHTLDVVANQPPVVPPLSSFDNPGFINKPVTYSITATDADTPTLNYSFNWGDGSPLVTGTFQQSTFVDLSHIYTTFSDAGLTVSLTVTDGSTPVTQTALQTIPMPSSTGIGVPNTLQGGPPIAVPDGVPLGGLQVAVMSSDGGVIQLSIDDSKFTLARSSAFDLTTDFGDISGRTDKTSGNHPLHQFSNRGIFVAKSVATNHATGQPAGIARITLPLSSKETGDFPPSAAAAAPAIRSAADAAATSATAITTKSLKGKFVFNGATADLVTYSGTITLPKGLTIGAPHEFWLAIGNIVVKTTLDKNGKGAVPGTPGVLKNLKVATKAKKGSVTTGVEIATVTATYSTKDMVNNGFDTEGISSKATDVPSGKSVTRMIQVAMLLDGTPFQSLSQVDFSLSSKTDFGVISGRTQKN